MSKNVKGKQIKTKQPSKALSFTKDILGGLISNSRVVEASNRHPWWVGLIIALISIWLPVFPIMTSYGNSHGSDFVPSSSQYAFNEPLAAITQSFAYESYQEYNLEGKKVDFKVKDNKLNLYLDGADVPTDKALPHSSDDYASFLPLGRYLTQQESGQENSLEVYYTNDSNFDNIAAFVNYLSTRKFERGTLNPITDPESKVDAYIPSFIVLTADSLYAKLFKSSSTEAKGTSLKSDWRHTKENVSLVERLLTTKIENPTEAQYTKEILNNWCDIFDEAFKTQKDFNITFFMGLYLGIYAILVFLMGALLFFMTRGRHNPFNYLKYITCNKIAWWSILSPAILTLIVGFLMPGLATMLFIILVGLRIMWMSMKQFRPQQ